MKTVSNLFLDIETFNNMQLTSSPQYVNMNTASTKIINWMGVMNKYLSGLYLDSSLANESNPHVAIAKLNNYTNQLYNATFSTCSNDFWTFDSANCTFGPT